MRSIYLLIVIVLLLIGAAVIFVLQDPYPSRFKNSADKAVTIRYENGRYSIYRFGQPFLIKGGAGNTHLAELHAAGGNTIRTWDETNLDSILADAERNQVAVIVGLFMPYNDNMDEFYNDESRINALFDRYQQVIRKYRNHKAVLCWCLGNELAYPVKPQYFKFYQVFNRFIDMIHSEDPDHPVTTALLNFDKKYLLNIKLWTHIDFVSFNIFGAIRHLDQDLNDFRAWWRGPFLIAEWAVDGPWPEAEHTAWNAFIEQTSEKKAEQYHELYERYMPQEADGFLGSMVFYWGYKQETTPTWFSLFDKEGNKSATVDVLQQLWTGKPVPHHAPRVKYMLVDEKGARDNLMYNPGSVISAQVYMEDSATHDTLQYRWFVQPEDWFRVTHFYNQKERRSLTELTIRSDGDHFVFRAPPIEGPYRVYVQIVNNQGYFASCNMPFYVVDSNSWPLK